MSLTGVGLHLGGAQVPLTEIDGSSHTLNIYQSDAVPVLLLGELSTAAEAKV